MTIEILPKVDRVADADKALWQKVLLEMLQISKFLKLDTFSKADLKRKNYSIFDVYIKLFLHEVSQLIHRGMQKKYILQEENKNVLRGSLMVSKHIQHNLIHRERFYTRHQIYSHNNKFNQILKKALIIIGKICNNSLAEESGVYLDSFEDVKEVNFKESDFANIRFNRMSKRYQEAISIAEMIICNFQPDFSTGGYNVAALLFDMNLLFESYVAKMIKREAEDDFEVTTQTSKHFWKSENITKTIRPDIIVKNKNQDATWVLDTKWKLPKDNKPSDEDLKQMYAYNIQFGAEACFLLYPRHSGSTDHKGKFQRPQNISHGLLPCGLYSVDVVDKDGLKKDIGEKIFELLMQ